MLRAPLHSVSSVIASQSAAVINQQTLSLHSPQAETTAIHMQRVAASQILGGLGLPQGGTDGQHANGTSASGGGFYAGSMMGKSSNFHQVSSYKIRFIFDKKGGREIWRCQCMHEMNRCAVSCKHTILNEASLRAQMRATLLPETLCRWKAPVA